MWTYIFHSNIIDPDLFHAIFKGHGFRELTLEQLKPGDQPTLLYVENPPAKFRSLIYSLKPQIEFRTDGHQNLTMKNNLHDTLTERGQTNYLVEQHRIDLSRDDLQQFKDLFQDRDRGRVWIFKPVGGHAGSGIKIFSDFDTFLEYATSIIKKHKKHWIGKQLTSTKLSDLTQLNNQWVLQEYITNPLLIPLGDITKPNLHYKISAGEPYKFHLRINLIHFMKDGRSHGYYLKKMEVGYGSEPYTGDFDKLEVHNTHIHDGHLMLHFPDSFTEFLTKKTINNIYGQITELAKILTSNLHTTCYGAPHCFDLFGIDVIITSDYQVKLLEFNRSVGLPPNGEITSNYLNGVYNVFIKSVLDGNAIDDPNLMYVGPDPSQSTTSPSQSTTSQSSPTSPSTSKRSQTCKCCSDTKKK